MSYWTLIRIWSYSTDLRTYVHTYVCWRPQCMRGSIHSSCYQLSAFPTQSAEWHQHNIEINDHTQLCDDIKITLRLMITHNSVMTETCEISTHPALLPNHAAKLIAHEFPFTIINRTTPQPHNHFRVVHWSQTLLDARMFNVPYVCTYAHKSAPTSGDSEITLAKKTST